MIPLYTEAYSDSTARAKVKGIMIQKAGNSKAKRTILNTDLDLALFCITNQIQSE